MHRAFLIYVAGLVTGLSAVTWSAQAPAKQPVGGARIELIGMQAADAASLDELMSGGTLHARTAGSDFALVQDPAPAADKPKETDRERLERKIRKLLESNGTKATQKQAVDAMLEQIKGMGLPPEFGEKFKARFDLDHVLDLAVKIHADHLDEETVDALLAFFATPSGKKLAEATPDITTELMKVSAEYGQQIGQEIGEELGK